MSKFRGIHIPCASVPDDYLDVAEYRPNFVDVSAVEAGKVSIVRLDRQQAMELSRRLAEWARESAEPQKWSDL